MFNDEELDYTPCKKCIGEFKLIKLPRGDEFSVFALEDCQQVSISGGRWNLDSEPMNFSTKGLHNQSLGEEISISTDGILAIIFQC